MNKEIFNQYEKITYEKVDSICKEMNASVFPKVRIADVFTISQSGLTSEEYSFALKSHFDFTVYDNKSLLPLFAIEYDGLSHRSEIQKSRDNIKNNLVQRFNLPLLRVNSRYLKKKYRDYDLLTWCIEVWFSFQAFQIAQENGTVPYDEIFDPQSIIHISNIDKKFPLYLSFDIRKKIKKLCEQGKLRSSISNTWIGKDLKGNYIGISWLFIDNKVGLVSTSGMKSQNFPIIASDFLVDIMSFELNEQLDEYFENQKPAVSIDEIVKMIKDFESKYKMVFIASGGQVK